MSDKTIVALILAAGEARRFGSTKQLARFEDSTLVARAVRIAESVCGQHTLLVLGRDWQVVAAACQPLQGFMVVNSGFARGMATSIQCGVRSVAQHTDGILLLLADQPLITSRHLTSLVQTWRRKPDAIVASQYAGTAGPPIIFPRSDFKKLLELEGDRGAKSVLEENRNRLLTIDFENAAVDIDRPEDLARL